MTKINERKQQIERRNIISSVFVGILFGLAYAEMVPSVRASILSKGITFDTSILFVIFFLTSIRFFIGNQLHLVSTRLVKLPGKIWFYDFIVIVIQTIVLIFLGSICSYESCINAKIGFFGLLVVLCLVDIVWICTQWLLGQLFSSWQRPFIPYAWAILNSSLVVGILLVIWIVKNSYSFIALCLLAILNVIAFIVDVILVDHYDLL